MNNTPSRGTLQGSARLRARRQREHSLVWADRPVAALRASDLSVWDAAAETESEVHASTAHAERRSQRLRPVGSRPAIRAGVHVRASGNNVHRIAWRGEWTALHQGDVVNGNVHWREHRRTVTGLSGGTLDRSRTHYRRGTRYAAERLGRQRAIQLTGRGIRTVHVSFEGKVAVVGSVLRGLSVNRSVTVASLEERVRIRYGGTRLPNARRL